MKNQNDLIVAGAVVLVSIGVALTFFFTAREPVSFPSPPNVVTQRADPPNATVTMAESLPGGSTQQSGPGGGQRGGIAGAGGGPQIGGLQGGGPSATAAQ